jgi:hypothetical protein
LDTILRTACPSTWCIYAFPNAQSLPLPFTLAIQFCVNCLNIPMSRGYG